MINISKLISTSVFVKTYQLGLFDFGVSLKHRYIKISIYWNIDVWIQGADIVNIKYTCWID